MKKDIIIKDASDIAIAIVPEKNEHDETHWTVYFFNFKETPIENVLINASASGVVDGVEKETANVRFLIEKLGPLDYRKIEAILPEALRINNRYWVSYYEGTEIFEKKFLIAADSHTPDNFMMVPFLNKPGLIVQ
jgi:hypothetical protein